MLSNLSDESHGKIYKQQFSSKEMKSQASNKYRINKFIKGYFTALLKMLTEL